ncbi:hypothetical protein [Salana multivorans]
MKQLVGVDALSGELNDVDIVAPPGAGDASFEDRDPFSAMVVSGA